MAEDNKKLENMIEKLATSVANGFESAKKDLEFFKLDANTHFNNLETDLKSFKNDTRNNFKELNEKFDDLNDTVMNHDKRIEVLEEKVV